MKQCVIFIVAVCLSAISVCTVIAQENTIVISSDLELIKLSESLYIHVSYFETDNQRIPANGLIYIVDEYALIVDTPWNDDLTGLLIDWLEESLHVKVTAVVATHWHDDCMGGITTVHERGINSYGHYLTGEIGTEKGLEIPYSRFGKKIRTKIGSTSFEVAYYGGGHTIDNTVVWIPSEKVLFGGCLVKTMSANGLGNLDDADVDAWPTTIRAVRDAYPDAEIIIPGHGQHGGRELLDHTLDLLEQNGHQ